VLVSNAVANPTMGPLVDTPEAATAKILDVNVKAALLLAQRALKDMRDGGAVLFVSSITAYNPAPPLAMYAVCFACLGCTARRACLLSTFALCRCARRRAQHRSPGETHHRICSGTNAAGAHAQVSKTALLGLVKALAAEVGAAGVRVNGVAPGFVPTKFSAALVASDTLRRQQARSAARLAALATSSCAFATSPGADMRFNATCGHSGRRGHADTILATDAQVDAGCAFRRTRPCWAGLARQTRLRPQLPSWYRTMQPM
jgi:NAD(P)-dependent dehydrogenase (short-subunit alcohol dehydrogenase family)